MAVQLVSFVTTKSEELSRLDRELQALAAQAFVYVRGVPASTITPYSAVPDAIRDAVRATLGAGLFPDLPKPYGPVDPRHAEERGRSDASDTDELPLIERCKKGRPRVNATVKAACCSPGKGKQQQSQLTQQPLSDMHLDDLLRLISGVDPNVPPPDGWPPVKGAAKAGAKPAATQPAEEDNPACLKSQPLTALGLAPASAVERLRRPSREPSTMAGHADAMELPSPDAEDTKECNVTARRSCEQQGHDKEICKHQLAQRHNSELDEGPGEDQQQQQGRGLENDGPEQQQHRRQDKEPCAPLVRKRAPLWLSQLLPSRSKLKPEGLPQEAVRQPAGKRQRRQEGATTASMAAFQPAAPAFCDPLEQRTVPVEAVEQQPLPSGLLNSRPEHLNSSPQKMKQQQEQRQQDVVHAGHRDIVPSSTEGASGAAAVPPAAADGASAAVTTHQQPAAEVPARAATVEAAAMPGDAVAPRGLQLPDAVVVSASHVGPQATEPKQLNPPQEPAHQLQPPKQPQAPGLDEVPYARGYGPLNALEEASPAPVPVLPESSAVKQSADRGQNCAHRKSKPAVVASPGSPAASAAAGGSSTCPATSGPVGSMATSVTTAGGKPLMKAAVCRSSFQTLAPQTLQADLPVAPLLKQPPAQQACPLQFAPSPGYGQVQIGVAELGSSGCATQRLDFNASRTSSLASAPRATGQACSMAGVFGPPAGGVGKQMVGSPPSVEPAELYPSTGLESVAADTRGNGRAAVQSRQKDEAHGLAASEQAAMAGQAAMASYAQTAAMATAPGPEDGQTKEGGLPALGSGPGAATRPGNKQPRSVSRVKGRCQAEEGEQVLDVPLAKRTRRRLPHLTTQLAAGPAQAGRRHLAAGPEAGATTTAPNQETTAAGKPAVMAWAATVETIASPSSIEASAAIMTDAAAGPAAGDRGRPPAAAPSIASGHHRVTDQWTAPVVPPTSVPTLSANAKIACDTFAVSTAAVARVSPSHAGEGDPAEAGHPPPAEQGGLHAAPGPVPSFSIVVDVVCSFAASHWVPASPRPCAEAMNAPQSRPSTTASDAAPAEAAVTIAARVDAEVSAALVDAEAPPLQVPFTAPSSSLKREPGKQSGLTSLGEAAGRAHVPVNAAAPTVNHGAVPAATNAPDAKPERRYKPVAPARRPAHAKATSNDLPSTHVELAAVAAAWVAAQNVCTGGGEHPTIAQAGDGGVGSVCGTSTDAVTAGARTTAAATAVAANANGFETERVGAAAASLGAMPDGAAVEATVSPAGRQRSYEPPVVHSNATKADGHTLRGPFSAYSNGLRAERAGSEGPAEADNRSCPEVRGSTSALRSRTAAGKAVAPEEEATTVATASLLRDPGGGSDFGEYVPPPPPLPSDTATSPVRPSVQGADAVPAAAAEDATAKGVAREGMTEAGAAGATRGSAKPEPGSHPCTEGPLCADGGEKGELSRRNSSGNAHEVPSGGDEEASGNESTGEGRTDGPAAGASAAGDPQGPGSEQEEADAGMSQVEREEWRRRRAEIERRRAEAAIEREAARRARVAQQAATNTAEELERRIRQRLAEHHKLATTAAAEAAAKEGIRARVRDELQERFRKALEEHSLSRMLRQLDILPKGTYLRTAEQRGKALKAAKIRFHPDKVTSSNLEDRVFAEELSKLLNSCTWTK